MGQNQYDRTSISSIVEFASRLTGKSLAEVVELPRGVDNRANRGNLGLLVEKYFFEIDPGTSHGPDFHEAGLELKTTGVKKSSKGKYKAKERLVLKMINFDVIVDEEWESSSLLKKCKNMLILFYEHDSKIPVENRKFALKPLLYRIPQDDLEIMRRDWEFIREKILAGKAHELSEGDTFYLGACRKGAGGVDESLKTQPFSSIGAKSRAFAFKASYVNQLLDNPELTVEESKSSGTSLELEVSTKRQFERYLGQTVEEIAAVFNFQPKTFMYKGYHRHLAEQILANGRESVAQLKKAGVEMKTIRLNANGNPSQSMSFPGFKFMDIVHETWEESNFFEKIERKFLFVVFQTSEDGVESLKNVFYWNMPYEDRMEAMRVWEETKERVKVDATNLPKKSESPVAHVRPKGRNGRDQILTPQGTYVLKQCFWLNNSYIARVVKEADKSF